jgi:hypothetical protein
MANVCRKIEIKNDRTAVVTYPSQEKQVIYWSILNDEFVIQLTGNKGDPVNRILTDSIYEMHLTEEVTGFRLQLKAKNRDLIYYLGRQR